MLENFSYYTLGAVKQQIEVFIPFIYFDSDFKRTLLSRKGSQRKLAWCSSGGIVRLGGGKLGENSAVGGASCVGGKFSFPGFISFFCKLR